MMFMTVIRLFILRLKYAVANVFQGKSSFSGGAKMITKNFLPIKPNTRPGLNRLSTENIVVHYSQGPGQSARQVYNFIKNRDTFGSYTFLVDDIEVIQLSELDEMTPHVGGTLTPEFVQRYGGSGYHQGYSLQNWKSVGICFAHPDSTGKPTDKTRSNLIQMLVYLCNLYDLTGKDIVRHYDVTRKNCPAWYVSNDQEWIKLKNEVDQILGMK